MIKVRVFCTDIVTGVAEPRPFLWLLALFTLLPQRIMEAIVLVQRRINTNHPVFNFHYFYLIAKLIKLTVILLFNYPILILESHHLLVYYHGGLLVFLIHYSFDIFLDFNVFASLLYGQCVDCVITRIAHGWLQILLFVLERKVTFLTVFLHCSLMCICRFFTIWASNRRFDITLFHSCHYKIITRKITVRSCRTLHISAQNPMCLWSHIVNGPHGRSSSDGPLHTAPEILRLELGPLHLFLVPEGCKPLIKDGHSIDDCICFILCAFRYS